MPSIIKYQNKNWKDKIWNSPLMNIRVIKNYIWKIKSFLKIKIIYLIESNLHSIKIKNKILSEKVTNNWDLELTKEFLKKQDSNQKINNSRNSS